MTRAEAAERDPTQPFEDQLLRCATEAARLCRGAPFHVVPTFDLTEDLAENLLAIDGVAGVILWTRNPALEQRHPGRVAHWRAPRRLDWIVPERRASHAIVFGDRSSVGLRILRTCARHRITWLLFFETRLFFASSRFFVPTFLAKNVLKRLASNLSRMTGNPLADRLTRFRVRRLLNAGMTLGLDRREFETDRVLYVTGTLGPGGSERQLVATARGVKRMTGYDVRVACSSMLSSRDAFFQPDLESCGIPVANLRDGSEVAGSDRVADICRRLLEELDHLPIGFKDEFLRHLSAIESYRPGILHAFLDDSNIKAALAGLIAGVPKIVLGTRSMSPLNFGFHQPHMRPAYQAILEHPNVVLLNNSGAGRESYRRWLGDPGRDIGVIYNGVALSDRGAARTAARKLRAGLGIADNQLVMGSAMRLSEEKGPLLWAQVAAAVARRLPDVRFLLAGDGPLRGELEDFAAGSGLDQRLHLLGHVRDTTAFMAALDLYVMTSRLEGLPNVLIEAQSLGTPVVTTPAGGAVEALEPGKSGLVSEDWTISSLEDACVAILTDDALRTRFAQYGADFVRQTFGIERMIEQTLDVYGSSPDRRGRSVGGADAPANPDPG